LDSIKDCNHIYILSDSPWTILIMEIKHCYLKNVI
jgi:hypothetical protein